MRFASSSVANERPPASGTTASSEVTNTAVGDWWAKCRPQLMGSRTGMAYKILHPLSVFYASAHVLHALLHM